MYITEVSMEVIAITNQKGGTGKTTSILGIGSALIQKGKKVLFIDLDPQSNLTRGLGMRNVFKTSADFMTGKDKCIFKSRVGNNSLIPANDSLYTKESELMNHSALPQNLLKKALKKVKDQFDYILIDCPPALGMYTINALIAADTFYIPMQAGRLLLIGRIEQSTTSIRAGKGVECRSEVWWRIHYQASSECPENNCKGYHQFDKGNTRREVPECIHKGRCICR